MKSVLYVYVVEMTLIFIWMDIVALYKNGGKQLDFACFLSNKFYYDDKKHNYVTIASNNHIHLLEF